MSEGHSHHAAGKRNLAYALALTLGFAAVEAGVGWWAGSMALVADAGHMLGDAGALALALFAALLAAKPASSRHSYGFGRVEHFAALVSGLVMLALVAGITQAAIARLLDPQPIRGGAVTVTALLGLGVNLLVAWQLRHAGHNLNVRAALLHVLGDLLGSVAALLAGLVVLLTGWTPIDPLLSLLIVVLLAIGSFRVLREALHGLMEGVPRHLALPEIGQALAAQEGVESVHDVHVWSLSGERSALSAHVVVPNLAAWPELLLRLERVLHERFEIDHVTLQPEPSISDTVSIRPPPSP